MKRARKDRGYTLLAIWLVAEFAGVHDAGDTVAKLPLKASAFQLPYEPMSRGHSRDAGAAGAWI